MIIKKLIVNYKRFISNKKKLDDNEKELKCLLLKLLHCEDVHFYVSPDYSSTYIESKINECVFVIQPEKIIINNNESYFEIDSNGSFIDELNRLIKLNIKSKIDFLNTKLYNSEIKVISKITDSIIK